MKQKKKDIIHIIEEKFGENSIEKAAHKVHTAIEKSDSIKGIRHHSNKILKHKHTHTTIKGGKTLYANIKDMLKEKDPHIRIHKAERKKRNRKRFALIAIVIVLLALLISHNHKKNNNFSASDTYREATIAK